jgi:type IV secretion system coupling TraD/TrwB family protein/amidohydrolase family protein
VNWNHGTNGLFIAFGISAFGVLLGLILGRATFQRTLLFPLMAIPIFFLAVLLWTALARPLQTTHIATNLIPYLGLIFIGIFSGLAGKLLAKLPENKTHKRGTIVSDTQNPVRSILSPKGLTLAGQPVPEADETKHFKMIGTTGTGKSTAIRELLTGALARGDRAVIADPDGSYLNRFYDPRRGDQILNPFDSRAARWDLFGEMTAMHDADQLSRSLIAEAEGAEGPWRNYARIFLTSLLRQLHRVKHDDVGELYALIATTPVDDLRQVLVLGAAKIPAPCRSCARQRCLARPHRASSSADVRSLARAWLLRRLDNGSRMTRECHVRFCERLGVRLPRPTYQIMLAIKHPNHPSEAISRKQAVIAYTLTAACAEFAEKEKGSLAPGKLADLAVLSQDVFTVPSHDLPKTVSVMTLVGGKTIYDAHLLRD